MKKAIVLISIAFLFASCEKNCGCFAPVTKRSETILVSQTGGGMMMYMTKYYGKYRDDCGNTKDVQINSNQYAIWPMVPELCD